MRTNETLDMPVIGTPSLDQLRVFLVVADAGSFSAAARRLNRGQSVVSYTIANLERQLGGLRLFDRGKRRPVLTEAGRGVLADARKLALGMDGLRARALGFTEGLEPELAVAVDVMLPTCHLVRVLTAFRATFPTVALRLYVEALGSVAKLVLDRVCAVGASGPVPRPIEGLDQRPLGSVRLVPVAAPSHPLAAKRTTLREADIREHVQLVLSDRSDLTRGQDFGVLSPDAWRLADLGAKHALLIGGLGWGNMPELMVRADIASGRLARLDIDVMPGFDYGLFGIHRLDAPPGPAGQWFLNRLNDGTAVGGLATADRGGEAGASPSGRAGVIPT